MANDPSKTIVMPRMVLGIDTTLSGCSVAITDGEETLCHIDEEMPRGQSERLVPMIGDALNAVGKGYEDLEAIGVTIGPGAFTGVRIGLSAARGLALSLGIKAIGVTTLQAIAHECLADGLIKDETLLVIIDSKRGSYFVQGFDERGNSATPPMALEIDGLEKLIEQDKSYVLAGDAALPCLHRLSNNHNAIRATHDHARPGGIAVAQLARHLYAIDAPSPTPLYLRGPDATPPKPYRTLSQNSESQANDF